MSRFEAVLDGKVVDMMDCDEPVLKFAADQHNMTKDDLMRAFLRISRLRHGMKTTVRVV